jgi:hypothetical protein
VLNNPGTNVSSFRHQLDQVIAIAEIFEVSLLRFEAGGWLAVGQVGKTVELRHFADQPFERPAIGLMWAAPSPKSVQRLWG